MDETRVRTHCRPQVNSFSIRQQKPNNHTNVSKSRETSLIQKLGMKTNKTPPLPPPTELESLLQECWSSHVDQAGHVLQLRPSSVPLQPLKETPVPWSPPCMQTLPTKGMGSTKRSHQQQMQRGKEE